MGESFNDMTSLELRTLQFTAEPGHTNADHRGKEAVNGNVKAAMRACKLLLLSRLQRDFD